jgi:hypothetical protein
MIPTEHAEQVAFVQWFERNYPHIRIFAIPNGGLRAKATAEKMRREGLRPGVPDLMVPAWHLFIEMKRTKGGRTSPEQHDWHDYLRSVGYRVETCKGALEAIGLCKSIEKIN